MPTERGQDRSALSSGLVAALLLSRYSGRQTSRNALRALGRAGDRPARTRPMIGAVLYQEWLLGSRRSRLYLFRWVYAGWLCVLVFYGYFHHKAEEQARLIARN